jgi:hypothetical protein
VNPIVIWNWIVGLLQLVHEMEEGFVKNPEGPEEVETFK